MDCRGIALANHARTARCWGRRRRAKRVWSGDLRSTACGVGNRCRNSDGPRKDRRGARCAKRSGRCRWWHGGSVAGRALWRRRSYACRAVRGCGFGGCPVASGDAGLVGVQWLLGGCPVALPVALVPVAFRLMPSPKQCPQNSVSSDKYRPGLAIDCLNSAATGAKWAS